MIGDVKSDTPVSSYQPSQDVALLTDQVRKDYEHGDEILNRSWVELNNMSVIDRMNRDQLTFNAFVDESVENPAEAWKWRGTRSKARNKAVAMHAQLTAGYIIPMFIAQDDNDEEDREFSDMMRNIVEWMVYNSEYKSSFLIATMGMLVNPVTYLGAEYCEVFQKVKQKTKEGYVIEEILDEVLSGFHAPVYSADQILIANAHEQNIQRQRFLIKRRYIEYSEAKAKYGEHENWVYVTPGMKSIYSEDDGLFYDVKDDDHPNLVMEEIYFNRREDIEVPFIGGIYMGDERNVEWNPIKHRDNRNAPKYNVTPFGYHRINEHFFYYKSLMNIQYWDNQLLDAQYEIGMNRAFLDTEMPLAVYGSDEINESIVFPSSVTAFADKDAKVQPLLPQANLGQLFNAMQVTENSMDESSVSPTSGGQLPEASQKATSVAVAQRNAQILLAGVGKTLAESVVQYGSLMADIAINHLTTAQVDNMVGEKMKLKYRTFILEDQTVDGKNVSKTIRFDEALMGLEMTEDEKEKYLMNMMKEIGYPNNTKHLYLVNPHLFSKRKYLSRVEPERMFAKNEEFMQAMYSQVYAQFANNPYISLEALTRKTLHAFFRGETDEIMKDVDKQQLIQNMQALQTGGAQTGSQVGQQAMAQAGANGLSTALTGMGIA